MKHRYPLTLITALSLLIISCQKDFLETRPDKALLVPQTLADFRALLDNLLVFNKVPGLTEAASGDFMTTDAGHKAWSLDQERNSYLWAADIYGVQTGYEWNDAYQQIFYANVVLDGLADLPAGSDPLERRAIEGAAAFSRAWAYYNLSQLYCPVYSAATATDATGVPLRNSPDITKVEPRSTLGATYEQMLSDLRRARQLLPTTTVYKSRPALPAVFALLARVYLARNEYSKAGAYADSALQLNPALLDFNTLTATATRPFPRALPNTNDEIMYYAEASGYSFSGSSSVFYCDPVLFASYNANDLRKTCYFRDSGSGKINFKGSYTGAIAWFAGIAADEMYLVRAECAARAGQVTTAMADLNLLLSKRWKKGTFVNLTAAAPETALQLILTERRKELVCRNMRWADLRRLNQDPRTATTLTHVLNGTVYTLEPGSPRYVYPIPPDEVQLGGQAQNPR